MEYFCHQQKILDFNSLPPKAQTESVSDFADRLRKYGRDHDVGDCNLIPIFLNNMSENCRKYILQSSPSTLHQAATEGTKFELTLAQQDALQLRVKKIDEKSSEHKPSNESNDARNNRINYRNNYRGRNGYRDKGGYGCPSLNANHGPPFNSYDSNFPAYQHNPGMNNFNNAVVPPMRPNFQNHPPPNFQPYNNFNQRNFNYQQEN